MKKELTLIALYEQVCTDYNESLWTVVQRFSSNGLQGKLIDQELMTIYLFCTMYTECQTHRSIWEYIREEGLDWFPDLPAYQTFNARLNRLQPAFEYYITQLIGRYDFDTDQVPIWIGDSCPITVCSGKRASKVAPELVQKSYCASKNEWYRGVKLHVLGQKRTGQLPIPQVMGFDSADQHDLSVMRPVLEQCQGMTLFLDKAYTQKELQELVELNDSQYFTPIKKVKGMPEVLQQHDEAKQKQVQTDVAKHRQPIESFFNWLHHKTGMQNASKVRSSKGLKLHIYGKFLAGLFLLMEII